MFGLLNRRALLEAAHDLYSVFYQNAEQEVGTHCSDWRDVPRLEDATQLPIIAYYLGRVHQAWGHDPGLVLHHMGIPHDEVVGQTLAIYRLLMGCLGHGVSLADDHGDQLDRAGEVLGRNLDTTPINFEGREWSILAEEAIQSKLAAPSEADETWPYQPGESIDFHSTMGTGDKVEGPGTVVKCMDGRIVVRLDDDHPERPGMLVTVDPDEVQD